MPDMEGLHIRHITEHMYGPPTQASPLTRMSRVRVTQAGCHGDGQSESGPTVTGTALPASRRDRHSAQGRTPAQAPAPAVPVRRTRTAGLASCRDARSLTEI